MKRRCALAALALLFALYITPLAQAQTSQLPSLLLRADDIGLNHTVDMGMKQRAAQHESPAATIRMKKQHERIR